MKTQLHHIFIIASIASTALADFSYAQEDGAGELEISDSEWEKAERDKILYSPGEGEARYVPKHSVSTTQPQSSKDSPKETLKESDLKTGIQSQQKTKSEASSHASKASEKQSPKAQPKPSGDDTILSFNFLYYIIQKYKLQDIVD